MRNLISTLVIIRILLFQVALAQSTFQKTYGGADQDAGYSVQQTSDHGYIVVGTTKSFLEAQGGIYLIRTNVLGDTMWTRTYGGMNDWEDASSVQQTSDGGFIFTGGAASFGNGGEDVYVVKVVGNGSLEWSETIGGNSDDRGYRIEQTVDSNYIIIGQTASFGGGGSDVYLMKLDNSGNLLWTRTFGGVYDDIGKSVKQTNDSGYIILAETSLNDTNKLLLIKTGEDGIPAWSKVLEGKHGNCIEQTHDGGYVLTGGVVNPDLTTDIFLYKISIAGNLLWARTYNGYEGESVQETPDGGLILLGDSADLIKTDGTGNVEWAKKYGGPGSQNLSRNVRQTKDKGFIITGLKHMNTTDYDLFLFKTDSLGNSGCTDVSINRVGQDFLPQIADQTLSISSGGLNTASNTKMNKVNTTVQTLGKPVSDFSYYADTTLMVMLYKSSFNDLSWHWAFGDGNIDSSRSTIYHTFANAGSYNVCLTATNNCGSDTYCKIITVGKPGIIEEKKQYLIKTYPNPSLEFVVIEFENEQKREHSLKIYNSMGQPVFQIDHITGSQVKINRENLSGSGLYFFRIIDSKGIAGVDRFIFE